MKRKTVYLTGLTVLIAGLATANPLTVSPDSFSVDAVAGDTVTEEVEVEWNGDFIKYVPLDTSVKANNTNTEGVNASLNQSSLVLNPGQSQTVLLTVSTSDRLVPDTFEVNVSAEATVQTVESDSGGTSEREVISIVEQETDETRNTTENFNKSIEEINQRLNEADRMENRIQQLEQQLENIRQEINTTGSNQTNNTGNQTNQSTNGSTDPTEPDNTFVKIIVDFITSIFFE